MDLITVLIAFFKTMLESPFASNVVFVLIFIVSSMAAGVFSLRYLRERELFWHEEVSKKDAATARLIERRDTAWREEMAKKDEEWRIFLIEQRRQFLDAQREQTRLFTDEMKELASGLKDLGGRLSQHDMALAAATQDLRRVIEQAHNLLERK